MRTDINRGEFMKSIRADIDSIDAEIIRLLARRRALSRAEAEASGTEEASGVRSTSTESGISSFPAIQNIILEDERELQAEFRKKASAALVVPLQSCAPANSERSALYAKRKNRASTAVALGTLTIGGGSFTTIAGLSQIISQKHISDFAHDIRKAGAQVLTGGCFRGADIAGLQFLSAAGAECELPVATEVSGTAELETIAGKADLLIIRSHNMQNFSLLIAAGRCNRPVMLQRGPMASIDELLNSAEYILSQGNHNVILCECGIRTFESAKRQTLDLGVIPALKSLTHLPVIVAPEISRESSFEQAYLMAKAARAVGADGLFLELAAPCESEAPAQMQDQFSALLTKIVQTDEPEYSGLRAVG